MPGKIKGAFAVALKMASQFLGYISSLGFTFVEKRLKSFLKKISYYVNLC